MAYKKFNIYEGAKIPERVLTTAIILGLAALAIIIMIFAKPGNTEEKNNDEKIFITENEISHIPTNLKNTQNLIK